MLPLDQGKEALTKVVTATFGLKAGSPARSVFVSDTSESSLGAYQLTSALLKEAETHEHSTWQQHQGKALLLGKGFSRAQAWALQACRQELVAGPNFQPSDLLTQPCDDFDKPASAPLRRGSSRPAAKATPVAVSIRASQQAHLAAPSRSSTHEGAKREVAAFTQIKGIAQWSPLEVCF